MILIKYDYNREVCEDTNHGLKLAQGVYNYKCEFENCDAVIGKLTIIE
jgi:hypothetical protein